MYSKFWTYVQILDHEHPLVERCGDSLHHPTPTRAKHYLYSTNSEGHHGFLLNNYFTDFIVGFRVGGSSHQSFDASINIIDELLFYLLT